MGAAVLALILVGITAAVVVLNRVVSATGSTNPAPANPAAPRSSGSGPQGQAAGTPSAVVRSYLEALAAGQAEAALALGEDQPMDKTFLSDAVLKSSNSRTPLTEISVPEVTDKYTYQVNASYKLGNQPVSEAFSVTKAGDKWKLTKTFADLNLSYAREKTLPMSLNGVAVKTDTVKIFPGSHVFTSGNKYVDYGAENVLLLKSPSDYPNANNIRPTLTKAGYDAFVRSAKAGIDKCLKKKELAPSGCPFGVSETPGQQVDGSTVTWKMSDSPWDNLDVRLDYQNPALAEAAESMNFEVTAKARVDGRSVPVGRKVVEYVEMKANLTEEPLKVTIGK